MYAMLDPGSATAQNLLTSRGYRLTLMRRQGDDDYWQLFDAQAQPCFSEARTLQFLVVMETPLMPTPGAVIAGQQVGRRVRTKVLQRASRGIRRGGQRALRRLRHYRHHGTGACRRAVGGSVPYRYA